MGLLFVVLALIGVAKLLNFFEDSLAEETFEKRIAQWKREREGERKSPPSQDTDGAEEDSAP